MNQNTSSPYNEKKYWLFEWLEEKGIKHTEDLKIELSNPKSVSLLEEKASDQDLSPTKYNLNNPIVAGSEMDLGFTACPKLECRYKHINELLRKVWYYFDEVLIADEYTLGISKGFLNKNDQFRERTFSHLATLIYIKDIGAENLVKFVQKPYCKEHWGKRATRLGMGNIVTNFDQIVSNVVENITYEKKLLDGEEYLYLTHPIIKINWGYPLNIFRNITADEDKIKYAITHDVVTEFMARLTADLSTCISSNSPLGSTLKIHHQILTQNNICSHKDLLFDLKLPIVENVDIDTLLKLRNDNKDSFDKFRICIGLAAKELYAKKEKVILNNLRREIRADIIEPELRNIESILKSAQKALIRKSTLGMTMGILATSCGLFSGLPPLGAYSAGLTVAVGSALGAGNKFIDSIEQVELSNMYFLWKSVGHSDEDE